MDLTDSGSDEETDLEDMPLRLSTEDSDDDVADVPLTTYEPHAGFPSTHSSSSSSRPSIPGLSLGAGAPKLTGVPGMPKMSLGIPNDTRPRMPEGLSLPFARPQQQQSLAPPPTAPLPEEALSPLPESVTVDLLSQAFVVNRNVLLSNLKGPLHASKNLHGQIIERCSLSLGVAPEELKLYQVKPMNSDEFSGTAHICVSVNNSTFSLTAIEELLQENKRLVGLQQTYASMSERHAQEVQEARSRIQQFEKLLGLKDQEIMALQSENMGLREDKIQMTASLTKIQSEFQQLKLSLSHHYNSGTAPAPSSSLQA